MDRIRKSIRISYRFVAIMAYAYMILPIVIFYIGWFKPLFAFGMVLLLLLGLMILIKSEYSSGGFIEIDTAAFLAILVITGIWVYTSGVGGYWPQRADWYWRNAIFRDLVEYSWPVEYPHTGNVLNYYFNYFLPAALVGKIAGWGAANFALFVFTWIGTVISIILICHVLKIKTLRQILLVLLIFMTWHGLDDIRLSLTESLGIAGKAGYEYSSHTVLLQWVTNQTIVPWIAVPLFLSNRNIKTYIYLGMCVLASAPFPFIGLLCLMVADGVRQLFATYSGSIVKWLKNAFSLNAILAIFTIFFPYFLFYTSNTSLSGKDGGSGAGLYYPPGMTSLQWVIILVSFLVFNFIINIILIEKKYRRDVLFIVTCAMLLLFPLVKIGEGYDFGMRAIIPAEFMIMLYSVQYLRDNKSKMETINIKSIMPILMCIWIVSNVSSVIFDNLGRIIRVVSEAGSDEYVLDEIHTLSNKEVGPYYCGGALYNFLGKKDNIGGIYGFVLKGKSEESAKKDAYLTDSYLAKKGFELVSGEYYIYPVAEGNAEDTSLLKQDGSGRFKISDSTEEGKYEIYSDKMVMVCNDDRDGVLWMEKSGLQVWGSGKIDNRQTFGLLRQEAGYKIVNGFGSVLTVNGDEVSFCEDTGSEGQLWNIVRCSD